MHRQRSFYTTRQDDTDMAGLIDLLIDQGLTRGLLAMQYTPGLSVRTDAQYDVAAVAVLRLLDAMPGHVSVAEVIEGLQRRAISLAPEVQ